MQASSQVGLLRCPFVVLADAVRDLAQVARPLGRDDVDFFALSGILSKGARQWGARLVGQGIHQSAVQAVRPGIIELRGNRTEDGQGVVLRFPQFVVALVLFAHVPQGIGASALVKLVDGDHVCEIEHVDFLQLGGGTKLGRHDVQGHIAVVHDFGVTLANARRFEDNQVKPGRLQNVEGIAHMAAEGEVGLAGGQGAHVDAIRGDGVHPDSVAEQCAAGFAFGGVDRHDGHPLVLEIEEESADQFVYQRTFPCAPCAGDAQNGNILDRGASANAVEDVGVGFGPHFRGGDEPREVASTFVGKSVCLPARGAHYREVAPGDDVVDHALQAELAAIVRVVNAFNAVRVELGDLLGQDGAAAATKNADVPGAPVVEQVLHVLEVLHVPTLVGGHGNGLGILLNGALNHLVDGPVMAQVDDFASRTLQDAPHDVDGGVVAVKQRSGCDDADGVVRGRSGGRGGGRGRLGFHGVSMEHRKGRTGLPGSRLKSCPMDRDY